jgi:hypothetical protein
VWAFETRRRRDIILFERLRNKIKVFVFIDNNIRNLLRVKIVLLLSDTEVFNSRKVFSVVSREIRRERSHSKRVFRCRVQWEKVVQGSMGEGSAGFNGRW